MSRLTFYRQRRFDGGARMGVELDNVTILEHYEAGDEDRDPALLWYIDLRCQGSGVPHDVEEARRWLLITAPTIKEGLTGFADHLRRVGADLDDYPVQWTNFPRGADDVERLIACSAVRRLDSRGLAEILDDVRDHWSEWIQEMIAEQMACAPLD